MRRSRWITGLSVIAALAAVVCSLGVANAEPRWRSKEVGWKITRFQDGSSTNTFTLDTTYTHWGGTNAQIADTTAWFNFEDLNFQVGMNQVVSQGTEIADTTLVGFLVVVADTSVDVTPNVTEFPYLVQIGRRVTGGAGVAAVEHLVVNTAATTGAMNTGDDHVTVPLYVNSVFRVDEVGQTGLEAWAPLLAGASNSPLALRVIFPATTYVGTTGFGSARAYAVWPSGK